MASHLVAHAAATDTASESVWSADDTTPSAVASALRSMLKERHNENADYVPARVLNLVIVVDRDWRGEVENRLAGVGRNHASRTVVCAVDGRRTHLAARAVMASDREPTPGSFAVTTEHIVLELGPRHLAHLDTIVDPLLVTDLATVLWSPHGHWDAVDSMRKLAQVILIDTVDEPEARDGIDRARGLSESLYVIDLAWLRSTPWRERIAATFDPPSWRGELDRITGVTVRHHPASAVAGMLLFGWLCATLGWKPAAAVTQGGCWQVRAKSRRQDVAMDLVSDPAQNVRGLAGITITTASGVSLSLDRGTGGLRASRTDQKGAESSWTVMGASRGEAGILGEGIRQALLRDGLYGRALALAGEMVG